ncbi:hypothetical protein [Streptomyces avermitilis]|uniref:hypothetical protein n=1 Tax=Streptomyces avermitilis TaxID=33903 RepID=UPI0033A81E5A
MPGISPVIDWNSNKAYQYPCCRHDTVADPSKWEVYTCCNCGTRFAHFPRLQRFMRHAGITCEGARSGWQAPSLIASRTTAIPALWGSGACWESSKGPSLAGRPVAYVEADYFGGVGEQQAAVWDGETIALGPLHV